MNALNIFDKIVKLLGWTLGLLSIYFLFHIFNSILSNLLIMRNTILWFLGESGMVGFLTIQAIWTFVCAFIFFFIYRYLFKNLNQ